MYAPKCSQAFRASISTWLEHSLNPKSLTFTASPHAIEVNCQDMDAADLLWRARRVVPELEAKTARLRITIKGTEYVCIPTETPVTIEQWLALADKPCQWIVTDTEIVVNCPNLSSAHQLWDSLDWSRCESGAGCPPTIEGKLVTLWAKGRMYGTSVEMI